MSNPMQLKAFYTSLAIKVLVNVMWKQQRRSKNVVSVSGTFQTQEMHYVTIVITLEARVFGIEPELCVCFVPNSVSAVN